MLDGWMRMQDDCADRIQCGRMTQPTCYIIQWSEDVIKADPFFGRSRVRFRVPPWVSNTIARDHLA